MRFAALGRTEMLYKSIISCIAHSHEIVLIGTCPASPEYTKNERDFEHLASKFKCKFFCDTSINSPHYVHMIKELKPDIAISMNWLTLIDQRILDLFKYGIINAHPGDLPRYRGNSCPNWAILSGEDKVVITLHKVTSVLDAGPVYLKREYPLSPITYIGDVYQFLLENVPDMFTELIDRMSREDIFPKPQPEDPSLSLRCFPRIPYDSEIDWNHPAEYLARLVRASAEPFAGAYTFLNGDKVIIWRARAEHLPYPFLGTPGQVAEIRKKEGEVSVITGNGVLVLEIIEIGGLRIKATKCIRSLRTRFGFNITQTLADVAKLMKNL